MESRFETYIDALEKEMKIYQGEKIDTVFIGGGTPSVLSADLIRRLCQNIKNNFSLEQCVEWSMEMNPGTVSEDKIYAMLEGGVDRASVGVQSFNDKELKAAGRIHSSETAFDTVNALSKGGFSNISIDLMQSLPMQTEESFKSSLETAVSLPIKHISVYSMILERDTPLFGKYRNGMYSEPDEDAERELYHYTGSYLADHGFERYEISNYAMSGYESRHNMMYWQCGEYIGIGVAAHSYYRGARYSNTCSLTEYLNGNFGGGEKELLTEKDKMSEFMMLGLRMTRGVSFSDFKSRFGRDMKEIYGSTMNKFERMGLLDLSDGVCRLTERGIDVSNSVMCEFIL